MKRNKWIELYHSALLEMAESDLRLPELSKHIALAQEAMYSRREELRNDNNHDLERKALDHALRNLESAIEDLANNTPSGRA
ncbi:MAG TPA: hypothetical protein VH437_01970 [Terriglobales bacterium]|jgi:hypothetical protein